MDRSIVSNWCKALFLLVCLGSLHQIEAQISPQRLSEIKSRYAWGSIYLTYGNIPDVITLLDNPGQLERIRAKFNITPPQGLVTFFSRYKEPGLKRSILVVQINFSASTPVAGYLTSTNYHGNISSAPLSPADVKAAADWVDLYLTHAAEWARLAYALSGRQLNLKQAWESIGKLPSDPFVTEDRVSSLLILFRQNQAESDREMESLKTQDPRLYQVLRNFAASYDAATAALIKEFSPETYRRREESSKKGRTATPYLEPFAWGGVPGLRESPYGSWHVMDREVYLDRFKAQVYQDYLKVLQGTTPP